MVDFYNLFGYFAKKERMPMDKNILARYETRVTVLKALAHPTRLFLVDELGKDERCVCELTAMVGADISTVSKHLAVLKNAGIVQDEKRGLQVFYSLKTTCVLNFFSCCEMVIRKKGSATDEK